MTSYHQPTFNHNNKNFFNNTKKPFFSNNQQETPSYPSYGMHQQQNPPRFVENNNNTNNTNNNYNSKNCTKEAIKRYGFVTVYPTLDPIQAPPQNGFDANSNNNGAPQNLNQGSPQVFVNKEGQEQLHPAPVLSLSCCQATKGQVPWRCLECEGSSLGSRCVHCSRPRENGALRVFVGKLNREGSAEMCRVLVQNFCTNLKGPIIHIESHTFPNSNKGKGCCWIYVTCVEDVKHIVDTLHQRTYVCVRDASSEQTQQQQPVPQEVGFIPFPYSVSDREVAECFQQDHDSRPRFIHYLLHRGMVTAEIPECMKEDVEAKYNFLMNANTFKNQQQQPTAVLGNPMISVTKPQQHQQPMMMPFVAPRSFLKQQQHNSFSSSSTSSIVEIANKVTVGFPNNQQQQQVQPPRPQLTTTSWYQEEEDEQNISSTSSDSEQEPQQQRDNKKIHYSLTVSPVKRFCEKGKRYHWNPYSSKQ